MIPGFDDIALNLKTVRAVIDRSAKKSGRPAEAVKLVVVSKLQPAALIRNAVTAGAAILGENYAEEGAAKQAELGQLDVAWHMIGHIQSRKTKIVAQYYDMVHSVDTLKLARRLNDACQTFGKRLPVLLEINIGEEGTKGGWCLCSEARCAQLYRDLEEIILLPALDLQGLMCMPPLFEDAEVTRPYFAQLRELRTDLSARCGLPLNELSMGTSADYAQAIEEGATYVRIGRTILGPRPPKGEPS